MRVAILAGLLLAGCPSPYEEIIRLDERFEAPLQPPTWQVAGAIERVETYHPAEHALRFVTAAELVAPLSVYVYDTFDDGHWIEFSTDCPATPSTSALRQPDGTWSVRLDLAPSGEPGAFERIYTSVPPLPVEITISSFVVAAPAGPCLLDNLRFVTPSPEVVW